MEASSEGDKIILSGTGQEGYFIDFESGTSAVTFPSYITDGSSGTDTIDLETGTVADSIILESGLESTEYDHIVLEDSLVSRRTINSIAAEQTLPTDPGAFNVDLETDADGIIDFSEGNPFGEAT